MLRTSTSKGARLAQAAEPNVIPFIDVLLVLLIIFMVTAPVSTTDIRVDLPPPNPIPRPHLLIPTIVELRESGRSVLLLVDGEQVEMGHLGARTLERVLRNNPMLDANDAFAEVRIFVRADQSTAYGDVVAVMSALQEDGFAQVGIFAQEAEDEI